MSTEAKPRTRKPRELTPPQKLTIQAYADPNSPTFGNKARAWQLAHPNQTQSIQCASTSTNNLLKRPEAQSEAERILQNAGYCFEVRVSDIAAAASGNAGPEVIKTTTRGADGKVTETIVEKPIPHTARVQYHKLMMQLTGALDRGRAIGRAQGSDLVKAQRDIMRRIKGARPGETVEDAEIAYESPEDGHSAILPAQVVESHPEPFPVAPKARTGVCHYCGNALPDDSHHLRRYCSDDCKKAASILRTDSRREHRQAERARMAIEAGLQGAEGAPRGRGRGETEPVLSISSPSPTSGKNNLAPLLELVRGLSEEEKGLLREALGGENG